MTILVLNGPNLNRLGIRAPEVYGTTSYQDLVKLCEDTAATLGLSVQVRQTNAEHELIEWLHEAAETNMDVILNAAAWTHTSIAVADACEQLTGALIEVHISNIHKREEFRQRSYISGHADGIIIGCGVDGYRLAIAHLAMQATS